MKDEIITITILNWDKYNPKRDQKTYTWLKLSNNFFQDEKLFDLSSAEKLCFIALLCQCSAKSNSSLTFSVRFLAKFSSIRAELCKNAIEKLNKIGILKISHDTSVSYTNGDATPRINKNRINKNRIDICQNEKIKESVSDETSHTSDVGAIIDLWNKRCGVLPKVVKISTNRKNKIRAQLKENPDLQYWDTVFKRVAASKFHTGCNDRNWKADFDWVMKPDKHTKIFEAAEQANSGYGNMYDELTEMRKNYENV